ncbi:MAG: pyridoxamine 5'-phosphate oxidase family protein [Mycobacteriaceae bacterium]
MPSARASIALTPEETAGLLAAGRILLLCTIGPDGLPDPIPMWYAVDEAGALVMTTYRKSQKVVNLRRDPRAVGVVEDGTAYLELLGVQITGHVEIEADAGAVATAMAEIARRYQGVEPEGQQGADLHAALRAQAAKRVRLRLVPAQLVSWDHRKLA